MDIDGTRRLSLDVCLLDLDDADALTAIVAAHAIAPARALCGMPRPRPGEASHAVALGAGMTFSAIDLRPMWPSKAPGRAEVESFIRAYVLVTTLIPHSIADPRIVAEYFERPGAAIFERAFRLALLTWSDLRILVDGLLGRGLGRPETPIVSRRYVPDPRAESLGALREIQALIRRSIGVPDDGDEPSARMDVGFQAMDRDAATALDEILRRDTHTRVVWLLDTELALDPNAPDPAAVVDLIVDRGVFSAVIPETLAGLIALDFVETLRLDPKTGICAECGRPVLLSPQRAARTRRGDPVYHVDCGQAHRRQWIRDYQRNRKRERARS